MSILALIHPTDLLGVELRESLDRRRDLWQELRLVSSDAEEIGTLTEVRGAAAMVQPFAKDSLDGVDAAFLSGRIAANRPILRALPPGTAAIVLSPDAGPEDGTPIVAGVNLEEAVRDQVLLSPHPGTVALAHLLHPLQAFAPVRVVSTLLQPVSTHGRAALDEVLTQTQRLLRFEPQERDGIFPAQLAFNLLPTAAPTAHVAAHLRTVLDRPDLDVAVQVLQAGVFHGYGISLFVELDEDPGVGAIQQALAEHPAIDVSPDPELLGPIDSAAQEQLLLGAVEEAPGVPGGYWVWAVMDNLTCGGALNALQILEAVSRSVAH